MRESLIRAIDARILVEQWRLLAAAFMLTASYSKLSDRTSIGQLAANARLHERNARRAVNQLAELGVLGWEPRRGRGQSSWIALPSPGDPTPPLLAVVAAEKTGPISTIKPGRFGTENRADSRPPSEKVPEKRSEEQQQNTDLPTAGAHYAGNGSEPEQVTSLSPAAALAGQEAPREARVREVVASLRNTDSGSLRQIEPLARMLSSETFEAQLAKLSQRRNVDNPPGLLRFFLSQAVIDAERALRQRYVVTEIPDTPETLGRIEWTKRHEPERWIDALIAMQRGADVESYLAEYVGDEAERARLTKRAEEARE